MGCHGWPDGSSHGSGWVASRHKGETSTGLHGQFHKMPLSCSSTVFFVDVVLKKRKTRPVRHNLVSHCSVFVYFNFMRVVRKSQATSTTSPISRKKTGGATLLVAVIYWWHRTTLLPVSQHALSNSVSGNINNCNCLWVQFYTHLGKWLSGQNTEKQDHEKWWDWYQNTCKKKQFDHAKTMNVRNVVKCFMRVCNFGWNKPVEWFW